MQDSTTITSCDKGCSEFRALQAQASTPGACWKHDLFGFTLFCGSWRISTVPHDTPCLHAGVANHQSSKSTSLHDVLGNVGLSSEQRRFLTGKILATEFPCRNLFPSECRLCQTIHWMYKGNLRRRDPPKLVGVPLTTLRHAGAARRANACTFTSILIHMYTYQAGTN